MNDIKLEEKLDRIEDKIDRLHGYVHEVELIVDQLWDKVVWGLHNTEQLNKKLSVESIPMGTKGLEKARESKKNREEELDKKQEVKDEG